MAHSNSQAGPVSIILFRGHSQLEQQLYDAYPPGANTEMAALGGEGLFAPATPRQPPARPRVALRGVVTWPATHSLPGWAWNPSLGCLTQSTGEGGSCGTKGCPWKTGGVETGGDGAEEMNWQPLCCGEKGLGDRKVAGSQAGEGGPALLHYFPSLEASAPSLTTSQT